MRRWLTAMLALGAIAAGSTPGSASGSASDLAALIRGDVVLSDGSRLAVDATYDPDDPGRLGPSTATYRAPGADADVTIWLTCIHVRRAHLFRRWAFMAGLGSDDNQYIMVVVDVAPFHDFATVTRPPWFEPAPCDAPSTPVHGTRSGDLMIVP